MLGYPDDVFCAESNRQRDKRKKSYGYYHSVPFGRFQFMEIFDIISSGQFDTFLPEDFGPYLGNNDQRDKAPQDNRKDHCIIPSGETTFYKEYFSPEARQWGYPNQRE